MKTLGDNQEKVVRKLENEQTTRNALQVEAHETQAAENIRDVLES